LKDERQAALIIQLPEVPEVPARIVQKYTSAKFLGAFKIVGRPLVVEPGGALIENDEYQAWLAEGVRQHPKVAQLWGEWLQPG
jgi:hypothetical protein